MKTFRILCNGACLALVLATMTACDENADDVIVNFDENSIVTFNADGYWNGVYDVSVDAVEYDGLIFSHQASATEWDGYVYYAWYGFCPSKSTDNANQGDGDWTSHQWGSVTGGGLAGAGDAYILGCWNSSEDIAALPASAACGVSFKDGKFNPQEVYVTNSAWGYYAMRDGSAFNKQFTDADWCTLHIYGVKEGKISGKIDVALAKGTSILKDWKKVDLTPLGEGIDVIYFQMTSSDTGSWGMNNPAYFCLDNFMIDML